MCTCIDGYRFLLFSQRTQPRQDHVPENFNAAARELEVTLWWEYLAWDDWNRIYFHVSHVPHLEILSLAPLPRSKSYVWHQDQVPVTLAWIVSHRLRLLWTSWTRWQSFFSCHGSLKCENSKMRPITFSSEHAEAYNKPWIRKRHPSSVAVGILADLIWFGPNFDTTNSGFVQTWLPFHSPLCQVRISYDGNARLTETARAVSCPPKDGWSSGWLPGSTKSSCNQHLQINSNNPMRVQSTSKY